MRVKVFISAILLTLICDVLGLSGFTKYSWEEIDHMLKLRIARVDISFNGEVSTDVPFKFLSQIQHTYPAWCKKNNENCAVTELPINYDWQRVIIGLEAIQKGKFRIVLMGPWGGMDETKNPPVLRPLLVDYKNLKINNKQIFSEKKSVWHNQNFQTTVDVNAGDIVKLSFSVRRHHFDLSELDIQKINQYLWFIITGNILFFFFIYQFLKWLADTCRKKSSFSVFFISLFFFSLFIPMSHISTLTKSDQENRMLAKKPDISEIFKENSDYGKQFENWFNDHFYGRNYLIELHDCIRNKISRYVKFAKDIYLKDEEWEFKFPFTFAYPSDTIKLTIENFKKFHDFCKENNIKLYLLQVPQKETVYQKYLYNYGFDKKKNEQDAKSYAFMKEELKKSNIPFVYPYEELTKGARKDYVYFKWTHHWTDWGAYLSYQSLMKEIQKDFPDIHVVSLDEYNKTKSNLIRDDWNREYMKGGHLERFLHIDSEKVKNIVNYIYYDHKDQNNLKVKVGRYTKDYIYPLGQYKIMLIGNSMIDNFTQFIPYSAKELKYIRVNAGHINSGFWRIMKLYKNEILSFQPDILILLYSTDQVSSMYQLFKE